VIPLCLAGAGGGAARLDRGSGNALDPEVEGGGSSKRALLAYYFANSRNLATIALHARLGFDCGAVPRAGADVHELSQRAYQKVAYRQSPDGWLAELPAIATDLERLRLPADPVVLGCANVEKARKPGGDAADGRAESQWVQGS
jgi:hypothetical protein